MGDVEAYDKLFSYYCYQYSCTMARLYSRHQVLATYQIPTA